MARNAAAKAATKAAKPVNKTDKNAPIVADQKPPVPGTDQKTPEPPAPGADQNKPEPPAPGADQNKPELKKEDKADKVTKKDKLAETMKPYLEAYPNEKKFYISSDGQVFLEKNKPEAVAHQKTIDVESVPAEYEA